MKRPSRRLTMNDALSLTRIVVFFSALAGGEGRGERGVVGPLAGDDLEQRHDGDRVEEVQADDPLRVLEVGGHLGDRQRARVGGEDALGRDDGFDLGPHLLLDRHLLEDRLDDEVGVGEAVLGRRAGDEAGEVVGAVAADLARLERLGDLAVDPGDALGDALLVEVGHDDRHAQVAGEEQGELAGHETGADDADLGDLAGEGLVGSAGRALGALLHEVERVEPGAQLVGHEQVGQRLVLGGEGLVTGGGAGGLDERRGRAAGRGSGRPSWRARGPWRP